MPNRRFVAFALNSILFVPVLGCAFSLEDTQKIKPGMKKSEVESVLGTPWSRSPILWIYDGTAATGVVQFSAGTVELVLFVSGDRETSPGASKVTRENTESVQGLATPSEIESVLGSPRIKRGGEEAAIWIYKSSSATAVFVFEGDRLKYKCVGWDADTSARGRR